ncbi:hypothetical protein GS425_00695 [Rhodococcus hoagii]|nr:hypothetical protein [Prescottella equi]
MAGTALSALVLGVPTAAADVVRVDAHPGLSYTWTPERGFEEKFGTNCIYAVTAATTWQNPVSFFDFQKATILPSPLAPVLNGTATVGWIPRTPGDHRIVAYHTSAGRSRRDSSGGNGNPIGSGLFRASMSPVALVNLPAFPASGRARRACSRRR